MIASRRSRCTPAGSLNARWSWIAFLLVAVTSLSEVAGAQTVAWTARKNGTAVDGDAQPGSGSVIAGKRALAVDGIGNVFVTGTAANGSSNDFLTVAYDPAGNVLWSKLRNGAANGADHAYALALGASGNVYVTGYSFNGTNNDFLTVAYDSAGNELWSKVKNGAANGSDSASALAVDAAENVYVTGGSHNGINSDYLTVAYDSAGNELWATVKNGAANLDDSVYALAVTPSGTSFVTGYSNNASNSDYMTVAYDSSGAELWARVKNGAGNGADSAQALAADASGNVFVTGYSFSGSTNDYLTVAYDISGNELWARSKNLSWENAFAVALDSTGRVLVTGISSNGATHDYLTVAYDSAGTEVWAKLKNGAANKDDFPYALVVDGSDNVFVTGYSNNGTNNDYLTVAYDSVGSELWAKVRNGAANNTDTAYAIGVRAGGGVYVTGYSHNGSNDDFLTLAYDSAGTELWGAKEPPQWGYDDRPGAGDQIRGKRALAVDGSGNVYVTGQASNGSNNDLLTVAYDSSGTEIWARVKNGAANNLDQAYALAVDGSGNVYVTGQSHNGSNNDYLTVAYDSAGNELWAKVKNGVANNQDRAFALAVDGSGNVYVTGQSHNGSNNDYLTVAYDSLGNELWAKVKNGAANGTDQVSALAVDGSGNVYVTGYSWNGSNEDYLTVAYDSTGIELWAKVRNGAGNSQDFASALSVDGSGTVHVTGQSSNGTNNDYLTVVYDSAGNELWAKVKNGAANDQDYAFALAVDGSGNLYVSGQSFSGSNFDYLTVAYDSAGTELWAKVKNGAANSNDYAFALAVDDSGNVYVTGYSWNGLNNDFLTVAYDSAGNDLWQFPYNGGGEDLSYIAVVSGTGLYVSGSSVGQDSDFLTVKFSLVADVTPPSDPAIGLTSPLESNWTSDNTVSVSWSGAVDEVDGSGIDGYSVEWNTTPVSTPNSSVDVNHTVDPHSTTSPPLGDGSEHYFHLSTCDNAGNCTSTVHAGPFWIDTAAPSAPGSVASSSHGDGLPHADSTIDLSWGAATDSLSGLGDYLYAFDSTPTGPCTGGGSTAGTSAASASLADGIWYAHVCSTDLAGNSSVVHGGPYRIGADLAYASTLVSHQAGATAITGNGASSGRYLSADGRYVAFSSLASDLVVGGSDANGVQDAFLWDRVTNLVTLISHLPGLPGTAASGEATATGISSDGAFVAFHSTAADMIAGGSDTNGVMDAFLWERATGIVTLISHQAGLPTTAGDELSYTANGALSADGQRVAIYSNATNLVAGAADVSATTDALMWDRATGLLTYISHLPGSPTSPAASYSIPSFVSADGEFVAFYSQATNLMSGGSDANGNYDVFLWERATGDVALASHVAGSPGVAGSGLSSPRAISSDGEVLVYLSYSTDLVPGFSNNNGTLVDTFAYVRSSGESELLSRTTAGPGAGGNSASYGEAVSADGRYVLLTSASTDLVPGVTDPNGTGFDVFLRDRVSGTTKLLTSAAGTPAVTSNNESVGAGLSSDGRFALYKSWATDLIAGMTPANSAGEWDVYLVDTVLGDTDLLSHSAASDTTTGNAECLPVGLASGGAVALMECAATDLAAGVSDPNGPAIDLYVAVRATLDSTLPTDPTIDSTAPFASTWSTDNTVDVSWSGAADEVDGSGLAGYSIEWDHSALSTPDPTVDIAHGADPHSTTSPPLADAGDWYFHLRTCDIAGNCTSTVHAGPFWIDTVAPSQPGALDSASHGLAGIPSSDVDLVVTWGAAGDAGAGVDGYSYFVDGSSSASCDLTKDAEEGTTGVTFAGLSQGTWYVHVCAVDSAGNWGPVRTGGPVIVDSTAPASATTVYYSRYSSGDLRRVGANGLGDAAVLGGLAAPIGLAIDTRAGKLYFSLAGSNQIARCDLDGTNLETLVTGAGGAYGVALDLDGGKVYWAARTAGAIRRANLDGTAVESVLTGLHQPLGVAFDRTWRKVYFTEDSFAPAAATVRIGRANPDGTNLEVLLTVPGTNRPYAIDVDPVGQVLYWVNTSTGTGTIRRLNYDGSGDAALVSGSAPGSVALEPVSQHLFWAEEGGQSVRRARTSGASAVTLSSGGSRWGVALQLPPTAPQALSQAISVPESGSTPLRLRAFDANNDALTWVQLTDPLHGSLSGTAPDLVYTPTPGYFGSDSFTFEVGDGTLTSPVATVSITVTPVDDPPTAPAIGSVVPAAGTWTNDNTVQISWSGAVDDAGGSGLAGYSIEWNHLALSTPDSSVEIAQSSDPHSTLSLPLADAGDWYFHLRACDLGGNCSTAVHVGPIQIDTVMPENILSLATDPPTNLWSADNTFELTWSGATDDRSGVAGYSLFISQATGLPDETIEVVHASDPHHFVTVPLADGELWAFKVRTCDRAGNCRPGAVLTAFGRIDTQAPTSPGTVSSSSHDGGVTNDPTIDVAWGAATDAGSGVASYRIGFTTTPAPPACGALPQTAGDTSTTSPPLAAGTWYFHVCAVDLAGNWGAVTTGGPYTIDLSAPRVANLDSVATSGGAIGEGEVVNVGITQLLVSFDEPMVQALAEATSSYQLVAAGIDGAIDTATCGPLQGDDQSVAIDSAVYAGQTSTLSLNGATALADGSYRLLVCAALEDPAGNPLDGDGNGSGGDDFSRSFRVDLARPTVTLVHSVADTGDGSLGENEATNVAITEVSVSFSEVVLGGDSTASFLLVEGGLDGALDTTACGPLAGDDTSVGLDAAVYSSLGSISTLQLSGGAALADGTYRLLVCGTVTDLGGNALDDDDDGDGNDDFARNFVVDTVPPTNPTAISSSTHVHAAWSPVTGFGAQWSGATDDRSGPAGYSVVIDGNPTTAVDCTIEVADAAGTGSTVATLGEGAWYVHVRLIDRAGNCAVGEAEAGFWGIDTSAPSAPGAISSSSHDPAGTAVADDTIDVAWGAASDTFSDVASYSYAFDGNPTGSCSSSSTASLGATSGALADGSHYVHVCAVDYAGNSGAAVHGGPYVVDTAGPTGLVASSISHSVSTWSNDNGIDFGFSGATDTSGVAGYAIAFDRAAATLPVCATTQAASTFTGSSSADGSDWWIHVRARDAAGNCGDTVHLGPFWIDTTAPSAPSAVSSSSHGGGPANDPTIDVAWGAATDVTSGVASYSYLFDGAPTGGCPGNSTAGLSATSSTLADGSWYLHVCAVDLAGNTGAAAHGGPYVVDTAGPTGLAISSTSHTVSTWSNDNSVDFSFSGATDANGIAGYAVVYDQTSATEPICASTQAVSTFAGSSSPDADDWWIHVRAVDGAGNCGSTVHLGPFQIDTQSPSAPTGLASPSHDVGVASNDTTVEVDWVAAVDQAGLSGIDGYGFFFSTSAGDACDDVQDVEEDALTTTSGALADGEHFFHLCAEDNAGNWSPVASIGPFVIDTAGASVVAIGTVADTGDGELVEGESTQRGLTQLLVVFDGAMFDASGDSDPADVTNPASYRLYRAGPNGALQTTACGAAAGDDVEVPFAAVSYSASTTTAALSFSGNLALPRESYRLLVCPTLEDDAGTPIAGFTRNFAITASDLLLNPNFDHDLAGWVVMEPTPGGLLWSSNDLSSAPSSGSAEIVTASGTGAVWALSQCFSISGNPVEMSGWTEVESSVAGAPLVGARIDYFGGAGCSGAVVGSTLSPPVAGDTGGFRTYLRLTRSSPPTAALSVLVSMEVEGGAAATFTARFDDLFYGLTPPLFSDGFESNGTGAWSAAVP